MNTFELDQRPEPAQESAIRARYRRGFAWPTLFLGLALMAAWLSTTYWAVMGELPLWLAIPINALLYYGFYTPVHEAAHRNVSGTCQALRWFEDLFGMLCYLPLASSHHHHRRSHMHHHAFTNQNKDPDIWARAPTFAEFSLKKMPRYLLGIFNLVGIWKDCKRLKLTGWQFWLAVTPVYVYLAIFVSLMAAGYWYELVMLWLIPWCVGMYVLFFFFTWTVHHDHTNTDRYTNTRLSFWPGGYVLLLGQNIHLIHHMMPSIPFYLYHKACRDLRSILKEKNARFEGFWPGSVNPR